MVKVGVVGVGNMGRHHARVYKELEKEFKNLKLVGVVDKNLKRAKAVGESLGVPYFADYRELLRAGVDAVSVAVPTTLHKDIAVPFLRAGVDVLVEKPIASTAEEAEEMVRAAEESGRILMVGHIERFNPAVSKLKQLLGRGIVGRPLVFSAKRVGPYPPQIMDTDVVRDLAIHDIDVIYYLLGEPKIRDVTVRGGSIIHPRGLMDYAVVLMEAGDAIGVVEANWLTPYKVRRLSVVGEKGIADVDYREQSLRIYDKEFTIDVRVRKEEPLKAELRHFIDCVTKRERPLISGEQALEVLRSLEKAVGN